MLYMNEKGKLVKVPKETRAHFMERVNDYIKKRKFVEKHGKILLKEVYKDGAGDEYVAVHVLFKDGHFIDIKRHWLSDDRTSNSLRVAYSKNYTQKTVQRLVKTKAII